MYRFTTLIVALSLCILFGKPTLAHADVDSAVNKKAGALTIGITSLDVNDATLKLSYDIRNDSAKDVWVLVGFDKTGMSAEAFMDRDDQTFLIRRRLDVPFGGGGEIAYGRYVLLRLGQTQTESITLATPVNPVYEFVDRPRRQTRGLEYATSLAIEIGYYAGDLPAMIRGILERADKVDRKTISRDGETMLYYFGGSLYFNMVSEILRQRDEEVLLPYTYQWVKGEKLLRTTVDGLRIPYEEEKDRSRIRGSLDISPCKRVEIRYQPSILEYFFPHVGQQSLLNQAERERLLSDKTIVVDDSQALKAFMNEIDKGIRFSGIVRARSMAQVVCYHEDDRLTSIPIYNDDSIVADGINRFRYPDGIRSLRMLTPQIKPFELRVQCAANLRNLWHRLRLYYKADKEKARAVDSSGKIDMVYPVRTDWCGSIVRAARSIRMLHGRLVRDEEIIGPHICPATGYGKRHLAQSHYAMNPNCRYDSPPDMVVLFETKAGWDQHGGPELFTFDNHRPKGGCVLLNGGTVKFIRTEEELHQLRWK